MIIRLLREDEDDDFVADYEKYKNYNANDAAAKALNNFLSSLNELDEVNNDKGFRLKGDFKGSNDAGNTYRTFLLDSDNNYKLLKAIIDKTDAAYNKLTPSQKQSISAADLELLKSAKDYLKNHTVKKTDLNGNVFDYSNIASELNKGNKGSLVSSVKLEGHEQAALLLDRFSPKMLLNFVNSIGKNELSSWRMPFLHFINQKSANKVLLSDIDFTKAYNLLYRIPSSVINDKYLLSDPNALIYDKNFYNNVDSIDDAKLLLKLDNTDPKQRAAIKSAVAKNNYGYLLSNDNSYASGVAQAMEVIDDLSKADLKKVQTFLNKKFEK